MSSTAVVQQKPLVERIYDRVKDQLGDMVTDDDLRPLVDRAMEDAFFKERGYKDQYGRMCDVKPPYLVEMVQAAMVAQVKAQVDDWFVKHPEIAAQAIEAALAKGLLNMTVQYVEQRIQGPIFQLVQQLRDKGIGV